ncbi:hypothetical protein IU470_15220 [Nocardia abscessus]|uniref:Uncharacterized protein n=2 Tax=Nocardia abscessus TaxID=120957 RepID=A0ABS0C7W2_9NOCA|nr:hypothetical protein [Nocardia abscessus]MBF6226449.1 hypothetical protein [Nocardia abscessus]
MHFECPGHHSRHVDTRFDQTQAAIGPHGGDAGGPALRLLGRPAVTGLDNIPRTGPVIIAADHLAVIDSL